MKEYQSIIDYANIKKREYPHLIREIQGLLELAIDEIEDGNSFDTEYNNMIIAIKDLIDETE